MVSTSTSSSSSTTTTTTTSCASASSTSFSTSSTLASGPAREFVARPYKSVASHPPGSSSSFFEKQSVSLQTSPADPPIDRDPTTVDQSQRFRNSAALANFPVDVSRTAPVVPHVSHVRMSTAQPAWMESSSSDSGADDPSDSDSDSDSGADLQAGFVAANSTSTASWAGLSKGTASSLASSAGEKQRLLSSSAASSSHSALLLSSHHPNTASVSEKPHKAAAQSVRYFEVNVGAEMRRIFDDVRGKLPSMTSISDDDSEDDGEEIDVVGGAGLQTEPSLIQTKPQIPLRISTDPSQCRVSVSAGPKPKSPVYIYEPPQSSLSIGTNPDLWPQNRGSPASAKSPTSSLSPQSAQAPQKSPQIAPWMQADNGEDDADADDDDADADDDEVARVNQGYIDSFLRRYSQSREQDFVRRPLINFDSDSDDGEAPATDDEPHEAGGDEDTQEPGQDSEPGKPAKEKKTQRISVSAASQPYASFLPTVVPFLDIDSALGGVDLDELLLSLEKNPYIIPERTESADEHEPSESRDDTTASSSDALREADAASHATSSARSLEMPSTAASSLQKPFMRDRISIHEQLRRDRCSQPHRGLDFPQASSSDDESDASGESSEGDSEVDAFWARARKL